MARPETLIETIMRARAMLKAGVVPDTIAMLSGGARLRTVARAADAAGAGKQAQALERRARTVESAASQIAKAERAVLKGITPMELELKAIRASSNPRLADLYFFMSVAQREQVMAKIVRLASTQGHWVGKFANAAGALREPAVLQLRAMRRLLLAERRRIERMIEGVPNARFFDSTQEGVVELFTKDGKRINLGPDGWVGIARGKPELVKFAWRDADATHHWVNGVIEVTLNLEVKGKKALDGLRQQLDALKRTSPHIAFVDGQFWLVRFDVHAVRHVLAAAPGEELDAVRGLTRLPNGGQLTVVEIPREYNADILELAAGMLQVAQGVPEPGKVKRLKGR